MVLAKDWVPEELRKDRLIVVGPIEKLAQKCGVENHPVDWGSRDKQDEFFRHINEMEGAAIIAVDEADMYYTGGGRSYGSKQLRAFINLERNHGKGWIVIARGDSDVAANTRGNITVALVFNTSERNLLRHADEWFFDVPEVVEYLTSLAPHEFMVWCPNLNPRWQGTGKVINGVIYIDPPPGESEPSEPDSEETPTSEEPANSPAVERPSPTGISPTSAKTTSPPGYAKG